MIKHYASLLLSIDHLTNHTKSFQIYQQLKITFQAIALTKSFLTMVLGDVNVKSKFWFDQDYTLNEKSILNDLMAQWVFTEIVHEPVHILVYSFSCIDLIFTFQETLVTNPGVFYHCILTAITKLFFTILI